MCFLSEQSSALPFLMETRARSLSSRVKKKNPAFLSPFPLLFIKLKTVEKFEKLKVLKVPDTLIFTNDFYSAVSQRKVCTWFLEL